MDDKISEENKRKKDEIGLYRPIKSIMINIEKFTEVFGSMNDSIQRQGNILVDIYDIQKNLADLTKDNIDKQRRKEELERVERTVIDNNINNNNRNSIIIPENRDRASVSNGFFSSLMENIGPGLGAFIGASLASGGAMRFAAGSARFLFRAIPLALIAPYIGNFITNLSTIALDQIGLGNQLSESQMSGFTEALGGAATTGTIGLMFGRRIGALFFAGDFIRRSLDSVFENNSIVQTISDSFGLEISENHVGYIGSALGAGIGLALPTILSRVGWVPILLGGMLMFGDQLREGLADMLRDSFPNGAESIANFTVDAATAAMFGLTGMRMGAMFGAGGALVGAVIGLTLGLGNMAINWFSRLRDRQSREFNLQVEEAERIMSRAIDEGRSLTETEAEIVARANTEAQRRMTLVLPEEEIQKATDFRNRSEQALAARPLNIQEGTTSEQWEQRISRAITDNDDSALVEMFNALSGSDENRLLTLRQMIATSSTILGQTAVNPSEIINNLYGRIDSLFTPQIEEIEKSNQQKRDQSAAIAYAEQFSLESAFLPQMQDQQTQPIMRNRSIVSDINFGAVETSPTITPEQTDAIQQFLGSQNDVEQSRNIFSRIYETIRDAAIEFNSAPITINNTPVTNAPVNTTTGPTNINNNSSTIIVSGENSSGMAGFAR